MPRAVPRIDVSSHRLPEGAPKCPTRPLITNTNTPATTTPIRTSRSLYVSGLAMSASSRSGMTTHRAIGPGGEPNAYEGFAKRVRRARRAALYPTVPTAAVARAIRFVVTQVRQALQQTAAAGAFSPYFPAT